jgi:hypothetical protein
VEVVSYHFRNFSFAFDGARDVGRGQRIFPEIPRRIFAARLNCNENQLEI